MAGNTSYPAGQDRLTIPVVAEQFAVGARTVDIGRGVRLHQTVLAQPVAIDGRRARIKKKLHITRACRVQRQQGSTVAGGLAGRLRTLRQARVPANEVTIKLEE